MSRILLISPALLTLSLSSVLGAIVGGTVVELGTGNPIVGASVQVLPHSQVAPRIAPRSVTAGGGRFEFDLPDGVYTLYSKADQYLESAGSISSATVTVRGGEVSPPVRFLLTRAGSIAGRLLDEESKMPITGATIQAFRVSYLKGKSQRWFEGKREKAQADGTFKIGKLPPGAYFLEILPVSTAKSTRNNILPGENGAQDREYRLTVWPNGGSATPLNLYPGGDLDVGGILLERKAVPMLTVHLSGMCDRGEKYNLSISQTEGVTSITRAASPIVCDHPARMMLVPGAYNILVSRGDPREIVTERAATVAVLGEVDETVQLELRKPVRISGTVLVEGSPESGISSLIGSDSRPRLQLWPAGRASTSPISIFPAFPAVALASDGSFSAAVHAPPGDLVDIFLPGLPKGFYIHSVTYNGHEVGQKFALNRSAMTQALKVTVSPKGAAVSGRVTDERGVTSLRSDVVLIRWPAVTADGYPLDLLERRDLKDGNFSFSSLAPGDYRIAAISSMDREEYEKPDILMTLLSNSQALHVSERDSKNVTLRIASR